MFSTVSLSQLHLDMTTRIHSIFVFSSTLQQDDPARKKKFFSTHYLFCWICISTMCLCVCTPCIGVYVSVSPCTYKCVSVCPPVADVKVFLFSISGFSVETDAHAGLCVFPLCLNLSLHNLCTPSTCSH